MQLIEAPKRFFIQYNEKIVLVILVAILITTVLRSTISLMQDAGRQEPLALPAYSSQKETVQNLIPDEDYSQLIKTIQISLSAPKPQARNLFTRRTEETIISTSTKESKKLDTDHDGMPDEWEIRFGLDPNDATDAQKDLDRDSYSNLDEYIGGSDPADLNSFPGVIKLRVLKIYRKSVKVNFFGYIKLPNGSFQIQINWGKRTVFLEPGQKIRGYKITGFFPIIDKKFNPQIGADVNVDASYITIEKPEESPITLYIGKPSFEKELYADIQDLNSKEIYSAHTGSKIRSYKVIDITTSKVIIAQNKKIYNLSFERNR
jgi:hypothetical protein